ncbi:MAG: rhodanese-like domain-containing protein [Chitinophagaceae bacterium]|jgi:adenylyltransferase/sulfurtransferase|nr:rhodanese-like domain-containing protein [Chitinophagaceae bacterium]
MKELSVQELKLWQQQEKPFCLLDVREEHEREAAHMGGEWIPMGEVLRHSAQLPADRPVVVYCRKGVRSAIVIQRLEKKYDMHNLYNLQGGLTAWQAMERQEEDPQAR